MLSKTLGEDYTNPYHVQVAYDEDHVEVLKENNKKEKEEEQQESEKGIW